MQLRFSGKQNKGKLRWVSEAAAAALAGAGLFAVFVSAFDLDWSPGRAFSGGPLRGLLSVWNCAADQLGRTDYIILKKYAAGLLENGEYAAQGLFLTLALFLLMVLAWLILRSRNRWLLLIYILPVLALLCTKTTPGPWETLFWAFGLICAFGICGRRERTAAEEGKARRDTDTEADVDAVDARWPGRLFLPVIALAAALCMGLTIDQIGSMQHQSGLQLKTSERIEQILDGRFGPDPLLAGNLSGLSSEKLKKNRGTIGSVQAALKGGADQTKAALTLSVSEGSLDSWYLRGFIGESYERDRWTNLGNEVYYSQRDTLYWLNQRGFDGLSQLPRAAELASEAAELAGGVAGWKDPATIRLSVRAKHARRDLIYQPYELMGADNGIPGGTQNFAGSFLKTDRLFGSRKYELTCASNMTGTWTDWVGRLYSAEQDQEIKDYFVSESHYNVWCYERYTGVPDNLQDLLYTLAGPAGDLSRDHAPYKETIENVQTCLEQNFIYSENFEQTEDGQDFLEQFIQSGKGCDVHYASLATELFRYFGIPARYVTGYLLTPEDLGQNRTAGENAGGSSVRELTIGCSHAHAWTEIYVDGFGWVPIEVTPEYRNIMQEADMSRGLKFMSYQNQEDPPEDMEEQAEGSSDQEKDYRKILRWILLLAILLLLALILWLMRNRIRRRLELRRRRKTFGDPDARIGICAMYGYMMDEEIPISQKAKEIGDLAAYSQSDPDEVMRRAMRAEMEQGEDEKKQQNKEERRKAAGSVTDRIAGGLSGLLRGLRRK